MILRRIIPAAGVLLILTMGLRVLAGTGQAQPAENYTGEITVSSGPLPASEVIQRLPPAWDLTLRRVRVPVLMYHYISTPPADSDDIRRELSITPAQFRAHLQYLREQGYETISFYDLDAALLLGAPLPTRPIILTFDDGHLDHYTEAFPHLREFGFTGTFFVITALADQNHPAHLSWPQIQEMAAAGMSMESHTKNHVDLRGRDYDFLVYEMLGSLESLAAYTGRSVHVLSYPVGHYDEMTLRIAGQLPIWRAVTTQRGVLHTTDNRLEVPRLRVHGNTGVSGLAALLAGN